MKRIRLIDEADRRMLERFAQERRAIAELNHANVVTVHDAGEDDFGLARGAAGLELSLMGYGMGTLDYATFYELLTG